MELSISLIDRFQIRRGFRGCRLKYVSETTADHFHSSLLARLIIGYRSRPTLAGLERSTSDFVVGCEV